ncbi:MAG: flagellar basal body L-ring protein FlgH [Gammaproteobacteria bacterium]|nr:flagellar basal body L-ring protein FlgH [Gammaproteobacteria bacterium]
MTRSSIDNISRRLLCVCAVLTLLSGCAGLQQPSADYRPAYPPVSVAPPQTNGGIYQAGYSQALFEDIKARRIGDTITVVLQERTQASKDAKTETSKDNTVGIENPTLLGAPLKFDTPLLPHGDDRSSNLGTDLQSNQEFKGEGTSSQGNSLSGNITVTVIDVLPNGNLMVRGEKWLTLNQGDEYIQISGIVRPVDVRTDNTVLSGQVADARITYSGKGFVADSNKMGWLSRFFASALWPY